MPRLPVWLRSSLLALTTLIVVAALQLWLLSTAARGEPALSGWSPSPRFVEALYVAFAAPPVALSALTFVIARVMILRRSRPLLEAFARVARGEFDHELPPPPEPDLGPLRDAFERMRVDLGRAVSQLSHQDAQRRRLFADLAHELGTPISSQLGLVDVLRGPRGGDEAERERLLSALERETQRLERLVRDLRDLALLDDPDVAVLKASADVAEIAARAASPFAERAAGPRVELRLSPVEAEVDALRIEQVVANLLSNAARHAPADSEVLVMVREEAEQALLVVEDEGPGVPEAMLARLGERLLRLDPSRDRRSGGAGLGLSIVMAIVQRHGGSVRFGQGERGGLRVEVRLPRAGMRTASA